MDLDEITIADLFQKAGYATGAFGKWHNGMQFPYHPFGRGFDYFYGFCSGHWGQYYDALMERNGELVEGEGYCVDDFTMEAMNFIERSVKKFEPMIMGQVQLTKGSGQLKLEALKIPKIRQWSFAY